MQSSITQRQKWFAKGCDCRLRNCPERIEIWSSQWIRTRKNCSHCQFMPHKFGMTWVIRNVIQERMLSQSSVIFLPPLHFDGTRQTSRMLFLHIRGLILIDVRAFDESPVVQNDISSVFKLSHLWANRDPKRRALGAVQFTLKGFEGYHVVRHSFIIKLCVSNDGCAQGFSLFQWHSLRNLEKVMPCEFKMTSLASAKNTSGCIYGQ